MTFEMIQYDPADFWRFHQDELTQGDRLGSVVAAFDAVDRNRTRCLVIADKIASEKPEGHEGDLLP